MRNRGQFRRLGVALLALVALTGIFATLALAAGAAPRRSQDTTISIMYPTNYIVPFKTITDNYTRVNPSVKFNLLPTSSTIEAALMTTQFKAGNAADINFFNAGKGNAFGILNFANAGYLTDLAGHPLEKRLVQPQLVGVKQGKHLWGSPMAIVTIGTEYNTDIFKQLGLTPPKTFNQLLTLCGKIKDAGKIPIAYPAGDAVNGIFMVYALIANDVYGVDPTWETKRLHNKVQFSGSPLWSSAYQKIVTMKNAGCFAPDAQATNNAKATSQFTSGQAAMMVQGTQNFSLLKTANPDLKFAMFPFPADSAAKQRIILSPSLIFGVNAASSPDTKKAALAFIDFMARPKQAETFNRAVGATMTGYMYTHNQLPKDWSSEMKLIAPLLKKKNPVTPAALWPNALMASTAAGSVPGLFTGQKTVDQILADLDKAYYSR